MARIAVALLGATAAAGASVQSSFLGSQDRVALLHFRDFIKEHGRTYQEGSDEYQQRFGHFKEHLAAVREQNAKDDSWTAGLNHLADWTPEELKSLRGYRHGAKPEGGRGGGLGLVSTEVHTVDVASLPKAVDYKHLKAMKDVQDQGGCGSCWAVSSATALRAHAELYQTDRTFSVEQLVACTPNPKQCGGKGGCQGATAELAMEYIARVGAVDARSMPYNAKDSMCPDNLKVPKQSLKGLLKQAVAFPELSLVGGGGASFGMTGWKKLPENKAEPLMLALYESGPVVVSVAAGGPWNVYASGIMDACSKGAVINHAVVLVGYGEAQTKRGTKGYWTIQNSWGPTWGESGFGRLPRLSSKDEEQYCGWDKSPEEGTACTGGPKKVWVCGSCGILYDNVVPKFRLSDKGWFARNGRHNRTMDV